MTTTRSLIMRLAVQRRGQSLSLMRLIHKAQGRAPDTSEQNGIMQQPMHTANERPDPMIWSPAVVNLLAAAPVVVDVHCVQVPAGAAERSSDPGAPGQDDHPVETERGR